MADSSGRVVFDRRALVFVGVLPLTLLALSAAVGRGIALSTGSTPFAVFYPFFPPDAVADALTLERWFASQATLTWVHIMAGTLVLVIAPGQFVPAIRDRFARWHRWSGRLLLCAAVPTALSGIVLQIRSPYGGWLADSAIFVAGALFLTAIFSAYRAIRVRDTVRHRRWMIRMFALSLGVATVRLVAIPMILWTGRRPLELIGFAFWLGFAIPVAAGELWIQVTRHPSPRGA
jgi:hypothetical protein